MASEQEIVIGKVRRAVGQGAVQPRTACGQEGPAPPARPPAPAAWRAAAQGQGDDHPHSPGHHRLLPGQKGATRKCQRPVCWRGPREGRQPVHCRARQRCASVGLRCPRGFLCDQCSLPVAHAPRNKLCRNALWCLELQLAPAAGGMHRTGAETVVQRSQSWLPPAGHRVPVAPLDGLPAQRKRRGPVAHHKKGGRGTRRGSFSVGASQCCQRFPPHLQFFRQLLAAAVRWGPPAHAPG